MKRLFIIGNGFDLAHKIPTRYLDYRAFLKSSPENEDFCMRMESTYGLGKSTDYWWRDFETNLGEGDAFETDFETMAECAIDEMVTDDGEEMYDVEDTLRYHFEPYYIFMNQLNKTVLQWVESIDINSIKPIFKRINEKDSYFFTFNYTGVLEKVYKIPANKICHIHGSVAEKSVIMGHGNLAAIEKYQNEAYEKEERLDKNGAEISRGIYKFYMNSFKDTKKIVEINESIINHYMGVAELHIFGHSLGNVDMPYFQEIKKHVLKTANWYFYVFCDKKELPEKRKELYKKIECLRIKRKYVHVLQTTKF